MSIVVEENRLGHLLGDLQDDGICGQRVGLEVRADMQREVRVLEDVAGDVEGQAHVGLVLPEPGERLGRGVSDLDPHVAVVEERGVRLVVEFGHRAQHGDTTLGLHRRDRLEESRHERRFQPGGWGGRRVILEGSSLWSLIDERARRSPDALIALDENGRRITFGEYRERVLRVAAALAEGRVKETGITLHWVDAEYDTGPVFFQAAVALSPGEGADTIAGKIQSEAKTGSSCY